MMHDKMAQTPDAARAQAYAFTNGVAGEGPLGFQIPVISAKPGDKGYSPLQEAIHRTHVNGKGLGFVVLSFYI